MILSRCCRHDILFLSHFHLPISTPTTFQLSTWWQGVGEGYLRKCALMLVVKEWELKGSFLLTCIKLSKKKILLRVAHGRLEMGMGTNMEKLILVKQGRILYHHGDGFSLS